MHTLLWHSAATQTCRLARALHLCQRVVLRLEQTELRAHLEQSEHVMPATLVTTREVQ